MASHLLIPFQAEKLDADGAQLDPPGFHLQPLPFADDVRAAPVESAMRGILSVLWAQLHLRCFVCLAGEKVTEAARMWISKLTLKNGTYQPDSYPNPGACLRGHGVPPPC